MFSVDTRENPTFKLLDLLVFFPIQIESILDLHLILILIHSGRHQRVITLIMGVMGIHQPLLNRERDHGKFKITNRPSAFVVFSLGTLGPIARIVPNAEPAKNGAISPRIATL